MRPQNIRLFQRHWVIAFICLALGIYISSRIDSHLIWSVVGGLFSFTLGLFILSRDRVRYHVQQDLSVALVFLGLGYISYSLNPYPREGDELFHYLRRHPYLTSIVVRGTVIETSFYETEKQSLQLVLRVAHIRDAQQQWRTISGRAIVYVHSASSPIYVHTKVELAGSHSIYLSPVNPRTRTHEDYLRNKRIYTRISTDSNRIELIAIPTYSPLYWFSKYQQFAYERLVKSVPSSTRGFIQALWLGDRSALSRDEKRDFVITGTFHILAISGLHIGLIYTISSFILNSFRVKHIFLTSVIPLSLCSLYALLSGLHGSSIRAVLMLTVHELYQLARKNADIFSSLSLGGVVLLIFHPDSLWDWGTQMSFSSVASILLFTDLISNRLRFLPLGLNQYLGVGISAQILLIPFFSLMGSPINLLQFLINLFVIPLLTIFLFITLFGMLFIFLPVIPICLFYIGSIHLAVIQKIASWFAEFKFLQLHIPAPSLLGIGVYFVFCYWLYRWMNRQTRYPILGGLMLGCLSLITWIGFPFHTGGDMFFLDVGHGDAILLRTPEKKTVLIDAGTREIGESVILPFLNSYGVHRIDYAIVTHADEDHIGGFVSVLKNKNVSFFLYGENFAEHSVGKELLELAQQNNTATKKIKADEVLHFGDSRLEVIFAGDRRYEETNANSLVLRYVHHNFSVFLPGDFPAELFQSDVAHRNCQSVILKLSHHGLKNSLSQDVLDAVQPNVAIASCNGFQRNWGVRSEVKELLQANQIPLVRTDFLGGIHIRFHPTHCELHPARLTRGYMLNETKDYTLSFTFE